MIGGNECDPWVVREPTDGNQHAPYNLRSWMHLSKLPNLYGLVQPNNSNRATYYLITLNLTERKQIYANVNLGILDN